MLHVVFKLGHVHDLDEFYLFRIRLDGQYVVDAAISLSRR